ncbi:hypothetical protein Hdeb2414_s0007g00257151 [Helianthus debilis subsp. tardiflorus]
MNFRCEFCQLRVRVLHVSISSNRIRRTIEAAARALGKGLYSSKLIALGSSSVICEEERRYVQNVHRLP